MRELKPIKEGKVREIYDNGDSLIMVATDRISCFDVILNNVVTKKRVKEIAQMLSGTDISSAAIENARTLLKLN